MEKPIKTLYKHQFDNLIVSVQIENTIMSPTDLYEIALRINKKRAFLFVSTVLGKHLPVRPQLPLIASALLAVICYEGETNQKLQEKQILARALRTKNKRDTEYAYNIACQISLPLPRLTIIGFAETATALGHGVYDCFLDATYIHSTRECVNEEVSLVFEEEHSHATDQRCYAAPHYFKQQNTIVLVDDELTTGQTIINIITSIEQRYPHKKYIILSLLDWRTEAYQRKMKTFAESKNITITCYSLLQGTVEVEGEIMLPKLTESKKEPPHYKMLQLNRLNKVAYTSYASDGFENKAPYLKDTGRFGTKEKSQQLCLKIAEKLAPYVQGKTLVVGTGEFMYFPMKIATYLGEQIHYQATTRSPIHMYDAPQYPIKNRHMFTAPEDLMINNFIYNLVAYDTVFIIVERDLPTSRLEHLVTPFYDSTNIYLVTL